MEIKVTKKALKKRRNENIYSLLKTNIMSILLTTLLMTFNTYSILGIIHLILFIWALIQILGSGMSVLSKILWIAIVFLFPVIGLIVYLLVGRG